MMMVNMMMETCRINWKYLENGRVFAAQVDGNNKTTWKLFMTWVLAKQFNGEVIKRVAVEDEKARRG